jgi:hypothetical protein
LWREWRKVWRAGFPKRYQETEFTRGFPTVLPLPGGRGLARIGPDQLRIAPLWDLGSPLSVNSWDKVLSWPHLARIGVLKVEWPVPSGWAASLAGCEGFRHVAELTLHNDAGPADVETALTAWRGRHLTRLWLNGAGLGDEAAGVLADHPTVAGLRTLELHGPRFTAAGLGRLLASPHLTGLTRLRVSHAGFGDAGVLELVRWPGLPRLRELLLIQNGLTDAGAVALADSPALARLQGLWLGWNLIGETGGRAIAGSPHLKGLKELYLNSNPVGQTPGRGELEGRFGKRVRL